MGQIGSGWIEVRRRGEWLCRERCRIASARHREFMLLRRVLTRPLRCARRAIQGICTRLQRHRPAHIIAERRSPSDERSARSIPRCPDRRLLLTRWVDEIPRHRLVGLRGTAAHSNGSSSASTRTRSRPIRSPAVQGVIVLTPSVTAETVSQQPRLAGDRPLRRRVRRRGRRGVYQRRRRRLHHRRRGRPVGRRGDRRLDDRA